MLYASCVAAVFIDTANDVSDATDIVSIVGEAYVLPPPG